MDQPLSHDEIIARLEAAGATLLALDVGPTGPAGYRSGMPEIVRRHDEAYGYTEARLRVMPPDATAIAAMDEALAWIPLIPADRYVLRRIVGSRALVNPLTGRHLCSWAGIARGLGAHHEAVRRWHEQGIGIIAARLARPGLCALAGGRFGFPARRVRDLIAGARRSGSVRSSEFV
jgi:hypothetical protein